MNVLVTNSEQNLKPVGAIVNVAIAGTAAALLTAAQVTAARNAGARCALISVATAPMRITFDGTDPTSTVGEVRGTDTNRWVHFDAMSACKGIRTTGTSADVSISFWA